MRPATLPLKLAAGQREVLELLSRSSSAPHREVVTAKALLMAGDGTANTVIAIELGMSLTSVSKWRTRFAEDGAAGIGRVLAGAANAPLPTIRSPTSCARRWTRPPPGQAHWSCRSMAEAKGISPASVQRIWS